MCLESSTNHCLPVQMCKLGYSCSTAKQMLHSAQPLSIIESLNFEGHLIVKDKKALKAEGSIFLFDQVNIDLT